MLHATCLIIGEAGVLIQGRSGAGKSALARALIGAARQKGLFARLVGDDRISVESVGGRVIARGHPAVAGLIEARGLGVLPSPAEAACVVRLAVDLTDKQTSRLPEPEEQRTILAGTPTPRLALGPRADRADLVFAALGLHV